MRRRRLLFTDMVKLKRLVDHADASPSHRAVYGADPKPGLLFVKDDGIYLMSSGIPGDTDGVVKNCVLYADGFDPVTNEDCWDDCRDAVGGDDFVEHIGLDVFKEAIVLGADAVYITATDTHLIVEYRMPKKQEAK